MSNSNNETVDSILEEIDSVLKIAGKPTDNNPIIKSAQYDQLDRLLTVLDVPHRALRLDRTYREIAKTGIDYKAAIHAKTEENTRLENQLTDSITPDAVSAKLRRAEQIGTAVFNALDFVDCLALKRTASSIQFGIGCRIHYGTHIPGATSDPVIKQLISTVYQTIKQLDPFDINDDMCAFLATEKNQNTIRRIIRDLFPNALPIDMIKSCITDTESDSMALSFSVYLPYGDISCFERRLMAKLEGQKDNAAEHGTIIARLAKCLDIPEHDKESIDVLIAMDKTIRSLKVALTQKTAIVGLYDKLRQYTDVVYMLSIALGFFHMKLETIQNDVIVYTFGEELRIDPADLVLIGDVERKLRARVVPLLREDSGIQLLHGDRSELILDTEQNCQALKKIFEEYLPGSHIMEFASHERIYQYATLQTKVEIPFTAIQKLIDGLQA